VAAKSGNQLIQQRIENGFANAKYLGHLKRSDMYRRKKLAKAGGVMRNRKMRRRRNRRRRMAQGVARRGGMAWQSAAAAMHQM